MLPLQALLARACDACIGHRFSIIQSARRHVRVHSAALTWGLDNSTENAVTVAQGLLDAVDKLLRAPPPGPPVSSKCTNGTHTDG